MTDEELIAELARRESKGMNGGLYRKSRLALEEINYPEGSLGMRLAGRNAQGQFVRNWRNCNEHQLDKIQQHAHG